MNIKPAIIRALRLAKYCEYTRGHLHKTFIMRSSPRWTLLP